jgi:uncharacterized protein
MHGHEAGRDELTGNDYISLPQIRPDAALDAVNLLHAGLGGLVEWCGSGERPFLRPVISVAGHPVALPELRWRRVDRWIPTFTVELPGPIRVEGTICAPGGYPPARGFLVRIEVENGGRAPVEVSVALEICWAESGLRIASVRALPGENRMLIDGVAGVVALEADGGRGPALAVCAGPQATVRGVTARDALTPVTDRVERSAANGSSLLAAVQEAITAVPNRRTSLSFYIGAGRERDGATAAALMLRRAGADQWIRQARLELSYALRSGRDHRWSDLLNRNLIFNRFYATARAIDDDRLYLLRSRSPLCPEPALFNEREALFWTLPALVLADPGIAREALLRVFELFSERSGEHRRYIDGGAFDPGFALDQFLLYAWAADHYVDAAGDPSVLDEPLTRQVVFETDAALFTRLHPQHMLCSTELLPSGDRADHPFTTLGNVLLRSFCRSLPRLLPEAEADEQPPRLAGAEAEVSAAIWQHCVADLDGSPVFSSSADLEGASAIYDDPAASLALLPFFGFCPVDDPVWTATMEFLRSPDYPLWRQGEVPGVADRSNAGRCSLAALCADLLGPAAPAALDRLLRLRLPGNLAATGWDAVTAEAEGVHHAALAGLVAWTLARAAEAPRERDERRRRR